MNLVHLDGIPFTLAQQRRCNVEVAGVFRLSHGGTSSVPLGHTRARPASTAWVSITGLSWLHPEIDSSSWLGVGALGKHQPLGGHLDGGLLTRLLRRSGPAALGLTSGGE